MRTIATLLCSSLIALSAAPAGAVAIGQTDNFEDGTTQNWIVGLLGVPSPAPPLNIATGGPAGAGDNYLLLSSIGGVGAGSRMTVLNPFGQWAGDYLGDSVTRIAMSVRNEGTTDLNLRLAFERAVAGPPSDIAISTIPIFVPAGSGWLDIEFPVSIGAMTSLLGTISAALSETTVLRLFHSDAVTFPGDAIVAQLGVDDITAIPTPATLMLLAAGLVAAGFAVGRRAS